MSLTKEKKTPVIFLLIGVVFVVIGAIIKILNGNDLTLSNTSFLLGLIAIVFGVYKLLK